MKSKKSSIFSNTWISFIAFAIIILVILWVGQILLLNTIYEYYKIADINNAGEKIKKNFQSNLDIKGLIDSVAEEKNVCIELINTNAQILYSTNRFDKGCVVGRMTNYQSNIIAKTEDTSTFKVINPAYSNQTLVYALKLTDQYYVFINASLEPMSETISLLRTEFFIVAAFILIVGTFISFYLAKRISKPIEKLTKGARELAKRNYDIKVDKNEKISEIYDLNMALSYSAQELSKTDNLRKELLANVSHDLKTPLTMIKAYAEMVRDISYKDKDKRNNNLNTIISESDRLNVLVNDILELSSLNSETVILKKEKIRLDSLIKNVVERFSYLYDQGYIIQTDLKEVTIVGDRVRLEQVLYNFLANAINHTGDDKTIKISIIVENNIRVVIHDSGKGIEPSDLPYIWDKYYKADKTHSRENKGTGIGLSIVKSILDLHGFNYGVESVRGQGTSFYFVIPKEK